MLHTTATLPNRPALLAVLWFGLLLAMPIALSQESAPVAARNEIKSWVRSKGFKMGANPGDSVFVAKGSGRDRLECLVDALATFAGYLGSEAIEPHSAGSSTNQETTLRASHRLRGYDIEHESVLTQKVEVDHQTDDALSRANNESTYEQITLVRKNGILMCALLRNADREQLSSSFFPTLAPARQRELENELMTVFVRDSHTLTVGEGPEVLSVFLIDCAPRR